MQDLYTCYVTFWTTHHEFKHSPSWKILWHQGNQGFTNFTRNISWDQFQPESQLHTANIWQLYLGGQHLGPSINSKNTKSMIHSWLTQFGPCQAHSLWHGHPVQWGLRVQRVQKGVWMGGQEGGPAPEESVGSEGRGDWVRSFYVKLLQPSCQAWRIA